jgi:hypothetical protein
VHTPRRPRPRCTHHVPTAIDVADRIQHVHRQLRPAHEPVQGEAVLARSSSLVLEAATR